ncbi:MAG: hypothetical protein LBH74_02460 [Nitrososphaerota archaeon]|jgi:hypothetical protein|nr:hypothetical protein [Nitrososphaerota archaeon]
MPLAKLNKYIQRLKSWISTALAMNRALGNIESSDNVMAENAATFVENTSKKTGLSERTIRDNIQIAKSIVPEIKEDLINANISKSDAKYISGLPIDEQINLAGQSSYIFSLHVSSFAILLILSGDYLLDCE